MAEKVIYGMPIETASGNKYLYNDNIGMVIPYYLYSDVKFADKWESQGLFGLPDGRECNVSRELIKKHLIDDGNGFKHLILSITESCNMRCKYCTYSEHYQNNKSYSSAMMDFDTAKMAVDYFYENFKKTLRVNPLRKPALGFYGGEPLLNFNLIQKVIDYVLERYPDYNTLLNVTTNGTLLNGDKLEYLIKNNVSIAISLDGPKEVHDRSRVMREGKGTFDIIMKNIREMKQKYPEYIKCMIIATYDWKTDLLKSKRFFDENKDSLPQISRVDAISAHFSDYYDQFSKEDENKHLEQVNELKKMYFERMRSADGDNEVEFSDAFLLGNYAQFLLRPMGVTRRIPMMPYTAACIPGEKISVKCDGTFHACERISPNFPIGNAATGLDFDAIARMVIEYNKKIATDCKQCPVKRICGMCMAWCSGKSTFEKNPSNICDIIRGSSKQAIEELYTMMEQNPKLYARFTSDYYKKMAELYGTLDGI